MSTSDRGLRLRAMGLALSALVETSQSMRRLHGVGATGESPAQAQITRWTESKNTAVHLTEAFGAGLKCIVAAEDYLTTCIDLSENSDRGFSIMCLLRAALESCGQGYWLLDPDIDEGERASRAMGGLKRAGGAVRRFGRKPGTGVSDETSEALEDLDSVVAQYASQHGTPKQTPKYETLIRQVVRSLDLPRELADAGLEVASASTHSEKVARDALILDWDDDGQPQRDHHLATEWFLWIDGLVFARLVDSAVYLFGWDATTWASSVLFHTDRLTMLMNEVRQERGVNPR